VRTISVLNDKLAELVVIVTADDVATTEFPPLIICIPTDAITTEGPPTPYSKVAVLVNVAVPAVSWLTPSEMIEADAMTAVPIWADSVIRLVDANSDPTIDPLTRIELALTTPRLVCAAPVANLAEVTPPGVIPNNPPDNTPNSVARVESNMSMALRTPLPPASNTNGQEGVWPGTILLYLVPIPETR
jgi:hypothetical protein